MFHFLKYADGYWLSAGQMTGCVDPLVSPVRGQDGDLIMQSLPCLCFVLTSVRFPVFTTKAGNVQTIPSLTKQLKAITGETVIGEYLLIAPWKYPYAPKGSRDLSQVTPLHSFTNIGFMGLYDLFFKSMIGC